MRKIYNKKSEFTFTSEGGLKTAQAFGEMGYMPVWKSRKHTCPAGQTKFDDIKITTEIKLEGGRKFMNLSINNPHIDDYIEFSIVDKYDVYMPGLFAALGLTPGEDIYELHKFVKTCYCVEEASDFLVTAYGARAFEVKPDLYLRIAYNSFGTEDITWYSTILWDE